MPSLMCFHAIRHLNTLLTSRIQLVCTNALILFFGLFCVDGAPSEKLPPVRLRVQDPAVSRARERTKARPAPVNRAVSPLVWYSPIVLHFTELSPRHGHKKKQRRPLDRNPTRFSFRLTNTADVFGAPQSLKAFMTVHFNV